MQVSPHWAVSPETKTWSTVVYAVLLRSGPGATAKALKLLKPLTDLGATSVHAQASTRHGMRMNDRPSPDLCGRD